MKTVRSLIHRLRGLFRKEQLDRDMSDELAAHLEMHIADNVRAGMSPEEARNAARREFGGLEQVKEAARGERILMWPAEFLQDIRLKRQPSAGLRGTNPMLESSSKHLRPGLCHLAQ
jgi:hypothetical protein